MGVENDGVLRSEIDWHGRKTGSRMTAREYRPKVRNTSK